EAEPTPRDRKRKSCPRNQSITARQVQTWRAVLLSTQSMRQSSAARKQPDHTPPDTNPKPTPKTNARLNAGRPFCPWRNQFEAAPHNQMRNDLAGGLLFSTGFGVRRISWMTRADCCSYRWRALFSTAPAA
ncbi:hypothetical protein NKI12_25895, partial [Mesorhizobium australicum]|uniref:hypothetical protein n=1 Tax=Mesorhizobium australicum TaxID=536018 RepID=UPI00333C1C76